MADPSAPLPRTPAPQNNAPVVLRIILAILLGIPGIIGICVFGVLVGMWIYEGFRFNQSDVWILPVFVIGAESFICFSVLTIGIVLRYARWQRATTASLVLAILSAAVIVIGYQFMLDCLAADDTDDRLTSLVFSILGLIVISVPPFLHWWNASKTA
jgi:hypothetical protein